MSKQNLRFLSFTLILLSLPILAACKPAVPTSSTDLFAQCLKDKGAIFYGAFWCGHCENQKKLFGSSTKFLPYVECSTSDGQNQKQLCVDKQIKGYPTWEFPDGSRKSGELSFDELAQKSGCTTPSEQKL